MADDPIYTILDQILGEVQGRLTGTAGGEAGRVCVYPGLIAWDDCECGQLAGSITKTFLSDNFPLPFTGRGHGETTSCTPAYHVVEMVVSLVRCAPSPQGDDIAPTCAALAAAAKVWAADAAIVIRGVLCELEEFKDIGTIIDYRVDTQTPVGPQGGCVGTDTHFLVGFEL